MTPAEKAFWSRVSNQQFYGFKFRRQHGVGGYIVDFYCPALKLVVEIDGDTHADPEDDIKRTMYLESFGYKVIRYQNREVMYNIDGVFDDLARRLHLL